MEELYKKGLNDPDNHESVVTHPEPDILECEVKWTLGSITTNKASGGDGIPADMFKSLRDNTVKLLQSKKKKNNNNNKALHSICQQFGELSRSHRTEKGQFSLQSQRRAMPKNDQTTLQSHSFHMFTR